MLAFFRKYQRFFYIIITTVIVISFSFFGTFATFQNPEGGTKGRLRDETVFIAIDGSKIPWRDLEALTLFIGTDNEDKLLLGGRWGPNFLNDGVIKKDFLETGMAEQLAFFFPEEMKSDLKTRQQKEKRFQFYQHPQAKFLNASNAWEIVAPEINALLTKVKGTPDLSDLEKFNEAFKDRVQLYLAERRFPHPSLRMVLRHQQKQYQWIHPDPALENTDLALFGYHTLDDWFGPTFIRLAAVFIINSAKIAEKQGYSVSKEEVLADLYHHAQTSFEQQAQNPYLDVVSGQEYLREQLYRMGMEEREAVALWRQVMLFRRLFRDLGGSILVDPLTVGELHDYTKETVTGDLYQLPEALRLGDFRKLQLFEVYLNAIREDSPSKGSLMALPKRFKSVEKVAANYPELVEKRYTLELAQINKRDLQAKVGVKETWDWEVKSGWEKLKGQFPELGTKKGEKEEERHQILSGLDLKTRQRVDAFARAQIVDENPSLVDQALQEISLEKRTVFLRKKGKNLDFPGLTHPEELIELLEASPLAEEQLARYSPDRKIYYRIVVVDRSSPFEVMTFQRALNTGALDTFLEKTLEAHYATLREKKPEQFQKKEGEGWKSFEEVRQKVAEDYFGPLVQEIERYYAAFGKEKKKLIGDYAASLRLYPYMQEIQGKLKKSLNSADSLIREEHKENGEVISSLDEQWKLVKRPFSVDRSQSSAPFEPEELFKLSPGDWSQVVRRVNGEMAFFYLTEKKKKADSAGLYEKVMKVRGALSAEAQRGLAERLLNEMKEKRAFVEKSIEV